MTHGSVFERTQIAEARLLIRYAAARLNETEKLAVVAFMADLPDNVAARQHGSITRGGIFMARKSALSKMRKRLDVLGVKSVEALL